MSNDCIYYFQGTVSETLVFQLLHANSSPPLASQIPFSAGSILERVPEGWPEPGPSGNLRMGKNWRSTSWGEGVNGYLPLTTPDCFPCVWVSSLVP